MSEQAEKREGEKTEPRIVMGLEFLLALEAAGVLQRADRTMRVVIDAQVDEPLKGTSRTSGMSGCWRW